MSHYTRRKKINSHVKIYEKFTAEREKLYLYSTANGFIISINRNRQVYGRFYGRSNVTVANFSIFSRSIKVFVNSGTVTFDSGVS